MSCACHTLADEVYARHVAAAQRCGCNASAMGDLLPTVVWPSDVRAKKEELNPHFTATNRDVAACNALDATTRASWSDFYASWGRVYRAEGPIVFGSSNAWDELMRYQSKLRDWQERFATSCTMSTPLLPKPPDEAGSADVVSAVKFAAVAVVVAATVYGVSRFV